MINSYREQRTIVLHLRLKNLDFPYLHKVLFYFLHYRKRSLYRAWRCTAKGLKYTAKALPCVNPRQRGHGNVTNGNAIVAVRGAN
jgi:hypothetical protein